MGVDFVGDILAPSRVSLYIELRSVLLQVLLRLDFSLVVDTRIAKVTYPLPDILFGISKLTLDIF